MTWLIYALLSTLIYAMVALLDRRIMAKKMINPTSYLLIGNFTGLIVIFLSLYWFVKDIDAGFVVIFAGIIVGLLFGVFTYMYFLTLRDASPVAAVAYMQIVPVVAIIGSVFIFNEKISEYGYTAILLLSVGLTFVSLLDRRMASHVASLMIPAVLLLSIGYILQKYLLINNSVFLLLILNRIGSTVFGFFIFILTYKMNPEEMVKSLSGCKVGVIASVIGEIGSILGLAFLLFAYEIGPFAEVSSIAAILPVMVLIGAMILNKFSSHDFWVIPEIKSISSILLTLVSVLLIALSIYMISGGAINCF